MQYPAPLVFRTGEPVLALWPHAPLAPALPLAAACQVAAIWLFVAITWPTSRASEAEARARDVDEVFAGLLRFSGGRLATFGCALHGPREQWYKITGSEATLTVPVPFAPGTDDRELIIRRGWQRGQETEERIRVAGVDQYQLMIEQFSDCVMMGGSPAISLAETRANVAAVSALIQSALGANTA